MQFTPSCPLAVTLAARLRASREAIVTRWLERIAARVSIDPNRVFPTDELLDHIPLLVVGIADYLENPSEEIAADVPVVAKAMELGDLRHRQGFDAYEILKEYELLGGVLFAFLTETVDSIEQDCSRSELLQCAHRVFHAVALIQQATTTHYLRALGVQVREREERLRRFNRMVSHELKTRIGAVVGAQAMLEETWLAPAERDRFARMIGENARGASVVLDNLTTLSRLDDGVVRQAQHIRLPQAAAEAVRQLRELARSRAVDVRISPTLPPVEVNAAAVELCLMNYVSNAVKYSDPDRDDRWVEIDGELRAGELVVTVRDNGLGVPADQREHLFERFRRLHEETITGIEGTGLGLSLVRETVESFGGRTWAEFGDDGITTFAFALPERRLDPVAGVPTPPWPYDARSVAPVSGSGSTGRTPPDGTPARRRTPPTEPPSSA